MALETISIAPSTNVVAVNYDEDAQELFVMFKGGSYKYKGVDGQTARGFASAPSAGRYLIEFVKDQFEYERIG